MFRTKKPTEVKETVYNIGSIVFDKWMITEFIGKGGFGRVFRIERSDGLISESSALKVITVPRDDEELQNLRANGMSTAQTKKYLEGMANNVVREISIMSNLKGTANIVSYEDCDMIPHTNGLGWDILIRMELLNPLLRYACEHPFSRRDIARLGIDICKALELCQKNNIIHRDVKPENIFVSGNGDFKLGDFGIARAFEHTAAASTKVGTCNYMAPEVFRGEKYGFSVDTYSLGIVLYRLLNKNRLPFLPPAPQGFMPLDQEAALARRMAGEPVPSPYYFQGRLPEIVLRACAPDVEKRFSSPAEMRRALEAIPDDPSDSLLIYPDEDTLKNLREIYFPDDTELIDLPAPPPPKPDHLPRPGKTARLFTEPESIPVPPPLLPEPNPSTKPERPKKPIGVFAAVGLCAVAAAAGLFMTLHGRNVTDAGELSAPPSQSSAEPLPSVSQFHSPSPSVSPSPTKPPLQATPETDFQIENGVLVKYIGSGGNVVIPDSVTSIGGSAFKECTGLTSVIIPDGVIKIGEGAFIRCTNLTSITIPDSVTNIEDFVFSGCNSLNSVTIPNCVKEIPGNAFSDCTGLTSVTIPDSVTSIGENAFQHCSGLISVTIPNSVDSIGICAFNGCTGLTSVTISNSVISIEEATFDGCTRLTNVTIPDSVTNISMWAFGGCTGLNSVTIPDSMTNIGQEAFVGCTGLTSVTIPNSVTNIEAGAFSSCAGLTEICVHENNRVYTSVDGILFTKDMKTLVEYPAGKSGTYAIPASVSSIFSYAFCGCTALFDVSIPYSVVSIGKGAFANCTGISGVSIPSSVISMGGDVFSGCTGLNSVIIPGSVASIEAGAFANCTGLSNVMISDSVTSLDTWAFANCTALTSVSLPGSVTSIGWEAFSGCTNLKEVYYAGTQAMWNAITIANGNESLFNATIYGTAG